MNKVTKTIAATAASVAIIASLTAPVFAAPAEKVDVCHVIEANDVIPFGPAPVTLYFGKVINVSENAVLAHTEHGDHTNFWGGEAAAGPIAAFRNAGAHLPAADCYYGVKPNEDKVPTEVIYNLE